MDASQGQGPGDSSSLLWVQEKRAQQRRGTAPQHRAVCCMERNILWSRVHRPRAERSLALRPALRGVNKCKSSRAMHAHKQNAVLFKHNRHGHRVRTEPGKDCRTPAPARRALRASGGELTRRAWQQAQLSDSWGLGPQQLRPKHHYCSNARCTVTLLRLNSTCHSWAAGQGMRAAPPRQAQATAVRTLWCAHAHAHEQACGHTHTHTHLHAPLKHRLCIREVHRDEFGDLALLLQHLHPAARDAGGGTGDTHVVRQLSCSRRRGGEQEAHTW